MIKSQKVKGKKKRINWKIQFGVAIFKSTTLQHFFLMKSVNQLYFNKIFKGKKNTNKYMNQ